MKIDGPAQSPELLVVVIEILSSLAVDYAVIGAMAGSFHGAVRASIDADAIVLMQSTDKRSSLISALTDYGLSVDYREPDFDDPVRGLIRITDQYGNQVDLLLGIQGFDLSAFNRCKAMTLFEKHLKVIGLEDYIAMKIYAGSALDLLDARSAITVSGDQIDQQLLEQLVLRYGKEAQERLALLKSEL